MGSGDHGTLGDRGAGPGHRSTGVSDRATGARDGALHVAELHVYPVKGAAGYTVQASEVDGFGLALDRRWMLVTPDGGFISQREHPRLARVRVRRVRPAVGGPSGGTTPVSTPPAAGDPVLVIEAPGLPPLFLSLEPMGGSAGFVRIWADEVEAQRVGSGADAWFSRFLGTPCHLVFMPEAAERVVPPGFGPARPGGGRAPVSFVDGFPFLLLSQASLDELNRRLPGAETLPMNRFRPNIVVGGGHPHIEDGWKSLRIGEVFFDVVKPCARCVVTTVDQETGAAGREPLRTLATYRRGTEGEGKIFFGQNLVHHAPGTLRVGDRLHIEEEGAPSPDLDRPETNPVAAR